LLHALLRIADRRQVKIEPLTIGMADMVADRADLVADIVEDALAVTDAAHLTGFLFGGTANEQLFEHLDG
jgi:hypothetical protein